MAAVRCFSSSTCLKLPKVNSSTASWKTYKYAPSLSISRSASSESENEGSSRSFFSKLLEMNIGGDFAPKAAHSKVLSDGSVIYELQVHHVKPDCMNDYKKEVAEIFPRIHNDDAIPRKLVGSWTAQFGKLDQAVHLWSYPGGYKAVSEVKKHLTSDPEMAAFVQRKSHMLQSRENQLLNLFHFWGEPHPKKSEHIYELRSYSLKPGTMIEWGNNWGRAIKIRQKHAVGGFFSQIGELYQVHHIWAYRDLAHRKEARELMWQVPGWDDCVANTVPLVNKMESRLLEPLPFSPLQ